MSPKQYKLLSFIRNQIVHLGKAPTFSEMKEHMEVTSNQTIGDWIAILEREGYVTREKGQLRGIDITDKGMKGFNESLKVAQPEAINKPQTLYPANTTSSAVYNYTSSNQDNDINIKVSHVIPKWKGGEKNGSS